LKNSNIRIVNHKTQVRCKRGAKRQYGTQEIDKASHVFWGEGVGGHPG